MRLEPGVERIELDGPFATGTTGRTVAPDFTREWRLSDVVPVAPALILAEPGRGQIGISECRALRVWRWHDAVILARRPAQRAPGFVPGGGP
jgi:hypothetical protein